MTLSKSLDHPHPVHPHSLQSLWKKTLHNNHLLIIRSPRELGSPYSPLGMVSNIFHPSLLERLYIKRGKKDAQWIVPTPFILSRSQHIPIIHVKNVILLPIYFNISWWLSTNLPHTSLSLHRSATLPLFSHTYHK